MSGPLLVLFLPALLVSLLGVDFGRLSLARTQAQVSADAGALAGAGGGPEEAERFARLNRVLGEEPAVAVVVLEGGGAPDTVVVSVSRVLRAWWGPEVVVSAVAGAVNDGGVLRLVQ